MDIKGFKLNEKKNNNNKKITLLPVIPIITLPRLNR